MLSEASQTPSPCMTFWKRPRSRTKEQTVWHADTCVNTGLQGSSVTGTLKVHTYHCAHPQRDLFFQAPSWPGQGSVTATKLSGTATHTRMGNPTALATPHPRVHPMTPGNAATCGMAMVPSAARKQTLQASVPRGVCMALGSIRSRSLDGLHGGVGTVPTTLSA
ncbi:hypothetical protein P7K49_040047 [Saguinus oedipus]|uniref:Uncharacterized protein n=1 Tax=Saguinus oedipus TaxID=9490 RepID=A0ABQ9TBI1_SAGOE|nr:hypothetical protein P7K49_040047 [Saguinus oedipus]